MGTRCLPRFIPQFVFVTQPCSPLLWVPPLPYLLSSTPLVSVLQGNGRQGQLVIVPVSTSPAWLAVQVTAHTRTSTNILVSFTDYFFPTFAWQLPDCHHKQSVVRILVSQSSKERSCICCDVGDKHRAKIFQIIAMMCPGLKLVLKNVKRLSWTYSNAKCNVLRIICRYGQ